MSQESLYDVLLVDQNATLDEIKLAFKRRALQVHPDKGGSKEAFHLVYQALETLADPEARRKYDKGVAKQPAGPNSRGTEGKTSKSAQPKKEWCPRPEKAGGSKAGAEPAGSPESNETKLLMKIRDLLKKLPRDVRNDVITHQFSQKQRLILEKWMVEASSAPQSGRETGPAAMEHPGLKDQSYELCTLPAGPSFSPSKKRCSKRKTRNRKNESDARVPSRSGYVKKKGGSAYTAGICFDGIEMHTRNCDLQSGLEYLVVLTAVKQKMQDSTTLGITFEKRLQEALTSSAKEHGKDLADLKLSFFVLQAAGFFIGSDLRTPSVRSVEQLARMRHCLQPFRQYAKNVGTRSIYWQHSPAHLIDSWEKFQKAVADAWHMAGVDSTRIQQTIRARHEARLESRNAQLQQWERSHMAMQDKHKHCPWRLRERTAETRLQLWERRKMALQDKNEHRPRKLQARLKLQRCPSETRIQLALKRLLVRWGRILKRQAGIVEKERRKKLQQRKVRRKKAAEERQRAKALHREHLRQERLRRENLRKRMRSDSTMADLFGGRDVRQPDQKNREGAPEFRLRRRRRIAWDRGSRARIQIAWMLYICACTGFLWWIPKTHTHAHTDI